MEQTEYKQMVARLENLTDKQFDTLLETMRQRKGTDGGAKNTAHTARARR